MNKIITTLSLLFLSGLMTGITNHSIETVYADTGEVTATPSRINMTFYDGKATSRGFTFVTNQTVSSASIQLLKKGKSSADLNWENAKSYLCTYNDFYSGHRSWKVGITDLDMNSTYYYRIATNSCITQVYNFKVFDGEDGITFMHYTDPQGYSNSDYTHFTRTLDLASKKFDKPDIIICTGDFSQQYKVPGSNIQEWGHSLNCPKEYYPYIPLTPVAGNHDQCEGFFFNHFHTTLQPDELTTNGFYYSYEVGDIHVSVLNTNDTLTSSEPLSASQLTWLENDLKNTKASWKILATHKGFYTTGRHYNESDINLLRRDVLPLISKYHVDLVLQGHDHVYARTEPYAWDSDGYTYNPIYEKETRIVNNTQFEYMISPGTLYSIPNTAAGHSNNISPCADPDDLPKYYKLATSPVNNKLMNTQPNLPMFSYFTIKEGVLTYQAYEVETNDQITLYDRFGIIKYTAREAERLISELPDKFSNDIKGEIAKALTYFNKLDEVEFAKVSDVAITKMTRLAKYIQNTDAYEAAKPVIDMIDALPISRLTEEYKTKLDAIETSYQSLSEISKAYVDNYEEFEAKKAEYEARKEAKEFDTKLLEVDENDLTAVTALVEEYVAFSELTKQFVAEYFELLKLAKKHGLECPQY